MQEALLVGEIETLGKVAFARRMHKAGNLQFGGQLRRHVFPFDRRAETLVQAVEHWREDKIKGAGPDHQPLVAAGTVIIVHKRFAKHREISACDCVCAELRFHLLQVRLGPIEHVLGRFIEGNDAAVIVDQHEGRRRHFKGGLGACGLGAVLVERRQNAGHLADFVLLVLRRNGKVLLSGGYVLKHPCDRPDRPDDAAAQQESNQQKKTGDPARDPGRDHFGPVAFHLNCRRGGRELLLGPTGDRIKVAS